MHHSFVVVWSLFTRLHWSDMWNPDQCLLRSCDLSNTWPWPRTRLDTNQLPTLSYRTLRHYLLRCKFSTSAGNCLKRFCWLAEVVKWSRQECSFRAVSVDHKVKSFWYTLRSFLQMTSNIVFISHYLFIYLFSCLFNLSIAISDCCTAWQLQRNI